VPSRPRASGAVQVRYTCARLASRLPDPGAARTPTTMAKITSGFPFVLLQERPANLQPCQLEPHCCDSALPTPAAVITSEQCKERGADAWIGECTARLRLAVLRCLKPLAQDTPAELFNLRLEAWCTWSPASTPYPASVPSSTRWRPTARSPRPGRSRREAACWDPATPTRRAAPRPGRQRSAGAAASRGAPADGVAAASTRVLAPVTLRAAGVVDHSRLPCSRPSWRLRGVQGNRYDRVVGSTASVEGLDGKGDDAETRTSAPGNGRRSSGVR
jgi:hypothetical protein